MMKAIDSNAPAEAAGNLFNVTSPDERRDAIAYLQTKPYGHGAPYMKAYHELSTDPHPMVRAQAMSALGTSYQPALALPDLIRGLNKTEDVQVRRDASYGLITTWGEAAFPSLIASLKDDPDEQVRGNCARALAHARSQEAVRALIDALSDTDAGVVKFAHDSLVAATGQNHWYDTRAWLAWYQQTYTPPAATQTQPAA